LRYVTASRNLRLPGAVPNQAVILSGSLGMGHGVTSEVVTGSLATLGWESRTLDCMAMLGPHAGRAGDWVFRRLTAMPGVYDGLHFAHFSRGSRLARAMDGAATARLVPALQAELRRQPAELIVAVFATAASSAARLAGMLPGLRTVVFCPDAMPYSSWVPDGIDLFLVVSPAAAAAVRRHVPRARVAIVPSAVRPGFYHPLPQAAARRLAGVPEDARCVLLMGGGWGLGPLEHAARALAEAGVEVLAVAGNNRRLADRLAALAAGAPRVHPFAFTERIAELMSAADVVVTLPGAMTCGEARVVGRRLVLIDAMPGHGRENLRHELEMGGADACNPLAADLAASVLAALDGVERPLPAGIRPAGEWDRAFAAALADIGVEPAPRPTMRPGGQTALDTSPSHTSVRGG
jgi:UDP-N-acetylglucosamine:LPS N-acetylglucosamine transferase